MHLTAFKNIVKKGFLVWALVHIGMASYCQERITKKVALVIGIQNYTAVPALKNALNDARDMSATLRKKGFEVMELYDPSNKKQIQTVLREYYEQVIGNPELAGLIYYSGHGIQVDGVNYLVPTHADLKIKADLDDQCVKMDYVMKVLEEAGNPLNILIMDACRNNPFQGFSRGTERGLSIVDAPKGSYIVYATKPGSVASDGTGSNGLFTSKLLRYINEPGLNIEQVFKRVAKDVADESADKQRPWISSDYTGDFFFTETQGAKNNVETIASNAAKNDASAATREVKEEPAINPAALFAEAGTLLKSGNVAGALNNLERAGYAGHAPSQTELGKLYRKSQQVAQDYPKSLSWFRKAADQGDAVAQNACGEFYFNGLGVPEDHPAAIVWFQKAAAQNNPDAMFNMATMRLNGRGLPKSESDAILLLTKAADLNHIPSQNKLGSLYLMGGESTKKNQKEAIRWFKKAAALGDTWAKETLESLGY